VRKKTQWSPLEYMKVIIRMDNQEEEIKKIWRQKKKAVGTTEYMNVKIKKKN
jgi:hypothetical protein